jgi:hypothetical protein
MTPLQSTLQQLSPEVSRVSSLLSLQDEDTNVLAFHAFLSRLSDVFVKGVEPEKRNLFKAKVSSAMFSVASEMGSAIDWSE